MKKICKLKDIGKIINDGDEVAIGGFAFHRHPMVLIYEIIRQNIGNLTLQGWNNGNDFDILIGAGLVNRVETSYVGMLKYGLAKNFRRAVENNLIKNIEYTEATSSDRFLAGAMGISFMPNKGLFGSDILKYNKDIKRISSPMGDGDYLAVPAAKPDVTLIHSHYADEKGNVLLENNRIYENEMDFIMARAAKKVIVSVEKIVEENFTRRNSFMTKLPNYYVDAVVEAPFGAHPCSNDFFYDPDDSHLEKYVKATEDKNKFQKYLDKYIHSVDSHYDYLDLVLKPSQLIKLQRGVKS